MRLEHMLLAQSLLFAGSSDDGTRASSTTVRQDLASSLKRGVLIVEDEALVALNIEGALLEAGFEVVGVVDTEDEAVAAAEELRPDAILLDITLREGDGIAAARRIQRSTDTKIIFISGNSDPRTLAAADALRPAGFIRKPFVTESLAKLVNDAIASKN